MPLDKTVAVAKNALCIALFDLADSGWVSVPKWVFGFKTLSDYHMAAFQRFTTQLLHRPVITEEVAEAFKKLAFHADLLDLGGAILASEDITELKPFIKEDKRPGAISLDAYFEKLEELCVEGYIQLRTLRSVSDFYERLCHGMHKDKLVEERFEQYRRIFPEDRVELSSPHAVYPWINPKALKTLLEAASSSPTCREITLSESLAELQFVRDFLAHHSYRFTKDEMGNKTYRRD